ncbi:MAG: hypothetical protein RJB06_1663, partial [Pseudomonadota bacterium]
LSQHGLSAADIGVIPAAAGGPKGLILGPLDRFIFNDWLPTSRQTVDLVGASIGAWRMATACMPNSHVGLLRLEKDYIHQHYALRPGEKFPSAQQVSDSFRENLNVFYGGSIESLLTHPRYRLHVLTSRGKGLLKREHRVLSPLGYGAAFLSNVFHRKAMGALLERVVFSSSGALPFGTQDYPTRHLSLTAGNFMDVLQASCAIPFVLKSVHDIEDAPSGAYWDGGITDYHLHLDWQASAAPAKQSRLVLYPHFQKSVVPGWLDKKLIWRHKATSFLDNTVVLAPNPEWVNTLPNGKLPDRQDFSTYGQDLQSRVKVWQAAVSASEQMAAEFAAWLRQPQLSEVQDL